MTAITAASWTRPPRQRTGVLGLGVVGIAVAAWLAVPATLATAGLAGPVDLDRVAEAAIAGAVPASAVLALGAVATRIAWLLVLAIPVLAIHALLLVVQAIVQGANGASGLLVLARLGESLALGLALVAVVVALVATAAARAADRREGPSWVAALVVMAIVGAIVVASPYVAAPAADPSVTLVAHTVPVMLLLAAAGVAGARHGWTRWAAAALALAAAAWLVLLETTLLPAAATASIAIAALRSVLLVVAGALVALSTRWLSGARGDAPAVVPPPVVPPREPVGAPSTGRDAPGAASTTERDGLA